MGGARARSLQPLAGASLTSARDIAVGATYRLQLHAGFGFDDAAAVVPYLADLGVTHLYASPILEAAAGSTHGYDVVDHGRVSDALGGRAGLERLVEALRARRMGLLVDIVPNHMSIADVRNGWWWDVLENGPSARAARVFDVDWDAPEQKLKSVVLVPILDDHRGAVLRRGDLRVDRERARFLVRYRDHRLPVSPRTLGQILAAAARTAGSDRLGFLADAYGELPLATTLDRASTERRHRDRAVLGELLDELLAAAPHLADAIDAAVAALNADVDALDAFLDRQNYRLAYWRAANRDLDYRRFFDIDTLVGLRVEDERVFQATHAFLGELVEARLIDGVRVDHVDGLADPAEYLARLRALVGRRPIYVEKILARDEALREWPVEGTTGYDFAAELAALFVDPRGEAPLAALQRELAGEARPFAAIAAEARLQVLDEGLSADLTRLSNLAAAICERHRDARDFTRHDLHAALRALVAAFPTYRAYVAPVRGEVAPDDVAQVEAAVAGARALAPELEPQVFAFLAEVLLLRRTGGDEAELVRRFQQLTPPTAAKGVEDTAFYRDARLFAANEVGADPGRATLALADFHARNQAALARWPRRMLATSTHDTKRSEDARARGLVPAEDHAAFAELARAFFARTAPHREGGAPDPLMTHVALQALVTAWPIDATRLGGFLEKAAREAKRHTSWTRPAPAYEAALRRFAAAVLADAALVRELDAYVARIEPAARAISLAWALLKITSPGVPDFYQGGETFRYDLVDPDNRRPVSWDRGRAAVARARAGHAGDGDAQKVHVIRAALHHRRAHPHRFAAGSTYEPLAAVGPAHDDVIAFVRRGGADRGASVTIALRRPATALALLADTRLILPPGTFHDVLSPTGRTPPALRGEVALAQVLGGPPLALLHAEAGR